MALSRDGNLIMIKTCDGYFKCIQESNQKILLDQKRHNLPVTTCGFIYNYGEGTRQETITDDLVPTHVVTASADYTYNIIEITGEEGAEDSIVNSLFQFFGGIMGK